MEQHHHHSHKPVQRQGSKIEGEDHSGGAHNTSRHHHVNGHEHHHIGNFRRRFIISTLVSFPVLLLSPMIQQWLGFEISFPGDGIVLAVLSSFIFIFGGKPFLDGMIQEIKGNNVGMMTLIGVAISVAWAYSVAVTFGLRGMDFYWEMATLIDIMLIGHYLEMKSVAGASRSLELLVKMMPASARRITGQDTKYTPVKELVEGDRILVKPGDRIPVDGQVIDGESYVDESMLSGESKPLRKFKGEKVTAGSVNNNGSLVVELTGSGNDNYLHRIIKLVEDAQQHKSASQNFADRAAKILTYIALGAGLLTLVVWLSLGHPFVFALERMVTVMVISCPHALGLAVPLVAAISTSVSAQKGLLIRNRTAFENARKISTVVFDKTGTLTEGSHRLQKTVVSRTGMNEKELLLLAAAAEQHSEHYIAQGLLREVEKSGEKIPASENFRSLPGRGVVATVNGQEIVVAGPNYLKDTGIAETLFEDNYGTVVHVIIDGQTAGYFVFADNIRSGSKEAVKTLKKSGIRNLLLTGDNKNVAEKVSRELEMDGYFADVLPHEKLEKLKELQESGEFVAMVGDGVNDAPALAQADVGIAIGSGTDIAAETADIILVNSNPKDIANLILFGRATYSKMIQNLWWAAGYNIVAIPLAAGVLYSRDILLNPAVGAVLMSLSTIVVALNAQLLKYKLG